MEGTMEVVTYANHTMAELPSAFRVSSQASSMPTASIGIELTPITTIITNSAAVLCGRTSGGRRAGQRSYMNEGERCVPAHMSTNHPIAATGTKRFVVAAK